MQLTDKRDELSRCERRLYRLERLSAVLAGMVTGYVIAVLVML